MAVLPDADRQRLASQWMRDNTEPTPFTKADLRAAANAADAWMDANQASFIAALPLPFRTASTGTQKLFLFEYVLMRRQGKLPTQDG